MTIRLAVCGGVYSNPYALRSFLVDARRRGADRLMCLGDLGGFGSEPDAIWPLLQDGHVECIAGNYELAIGQGLPDCGCGYRDPLDNEFAQIAYEFTRTHTSSEYSSWMTTLPTERREQIAGVEVHLVHGSPLAVNDFWWESMSNPEHQQRIDRSGADLILCTHSGLPWQRRIGRALVVNVGVLGRPANDGSRDVWYAIIDIDQDRASAELVQLSYDWQSQAASMRLAELPAAFIETIETGWWTTCLEVLPPMERSRGRYHIYRSAMPALLERLGVQHRDGRKDSRPGLPVVPLFGTPLFPARLWIEVGASAQVRAMPTPRVRLDKICHRIDEAVAEGFVELAICGDAAAAADIAKARQSVRGRIATVADVTIPEQAPRHAGGTTPDWAMTVPEIMIAADGVYWCPLTVEDRVGAGTEPARLGRPSMSLAEAKRLVTQRFLAYRRSDKTIASVPTCAA